MTRMIHACIKSARAQHFHKRSTQTLYKSGSFPAIQYCKLWERYLITSPLVLHQSIRGPEPRQIPLYASDIAPCVHYYLVPASILDYLPSRSCSPLFFNHITFLCIRLGDQHPKAISGCLRSKVRNADMISSPFAPRSVFEGFAPVFQLLRVFP